MPASSSTPESHELARRAARFIGRSAERCRRCRGESHWVNRMFGIACLTCEPPGDSSRDVVLYLEFRGGVWHNDEWIEQAIADRPHDVPDESGELTTEHTINQIGIVLGRFWMTDRALHAFADDAADWVWFDPLRMPRSPERPGEVWWCAFL